MIMKALQNNFTTPEQSKRLLELGVPADSADCFIYINSVGQDIGILDFPYSEVEKEGFCPCWSVGRLIEIYDMCFIYPKSRSSWCAYTRVKGVLFVDYILDCYKNAIADKLLDFSKLED